MKSNAARKHDSQKEHQSSGESDDMAFKSKRQNQRKDKANVPVTRADLEKLFRKVTEKIFSKYEQLRIELMGEIDKSHKETTDAIEKSSDETKAAIKETNEKVADLAVKFAELNGKLNILIVVLIVFTASLYVENIPNLLPNREERESSSEPTVEAAGDVSANQQLPEVQGFQIVNEHSETTQNVNRNVNCQPEDSPGTPPIPDLSTRSQSATQTVSEPCLKPALNAEKNSELPGLVNSTDRPRQNLARSTSSFRVCSTYHSPP